MKKSKTQFIEKWKEQWIQRRLKIHVRLEESSKHTYTCKSYIILTKCFVSYFKFQRNPYNIGKRTHISIQKNTTQEFK
jgi:hypothetical protein